MSFAGKIANQRVARLIVIVPLILVGLFYFPHAYGDVLPSRSLSLSDARVNVTAEYTLGMTVPSPEMLGSIKLQFCANDPLFSDPCVAPAGFDISGATLSNQTGTTGFTVLASGTNANTLVLSRTPSAIAMATASSFTLQGVVNPSSQGAYYGRLQTFASNDANGPENDHGGLAFSIVSPVQISTTVPPYLLFCAGITIDGLDCGTASGDYINFGNFSDAATSSAQSQMVLATNAQFGYAVHMLGSTMTSGNNVINPMTIRDVSKPGTGQFGLNLTANQTPLVGSAPEGAGSAVSTADYDVPNWYKFNSGDTLLTTSNADSYRKFTVSYVVNVPKDQTPGVYVATLTYICLANF
jgi:hypothetical protein